MTSLCLLKKAATRSEGLWPGGVHKNLAKKDLTSVRHIENNFANSGAADCRVVAQLDSSECYKLELLEDANIVEHVLRGTRISHNCLRVESFTSMVRSRYGGSGAVDLIVLRGNVCVVEAIAAEIADGR
jgi:hypothetical protein